MKPGIGLSLLNGYGMAEVGTAQECIEQLRRFEAGCVTNILCAVGAGAARAEIVQESLHCIATEVMPVFRQE